MKSNIKKAKICLEIEEDSIKLSELVLSKDRKAFRLAAKNVSSKDDDLIAKEIKDIFSSLNISEKRVSVNIPRYNAMVRFLKLPSTADDEIKNMVNIELAKQIPSAAAGEYIINYRIIERLADGYSMVFLASVQAALIGRLINILKKAGLGIDKIALSSESLFAWYGVIKTEEDDGRSIAVINVDSPYTDMDILEKGKIAFNRAFSYAVAAYSPRKVVDEIKRSVMTFDKARHAVVDKIYISGAVGKVAEIAPILREELNIPLEAIPQTKAIEFDGDEVLREFSFVELIGLSLKDEDVRMNFLPEGMKRERGMRILRRHVLKTAVLAIGIVLILFGMTAKRIFDAQRFLGLLDSQLNAIEPKIAPAKKMREDIRIIKNDMLKMPLAIDILTEIHKLTPADIIYSLMDYDDSRSLVLRGCGPSLNAIIKFISVLENSPYFENAEIRYTQERASSQGRLTDFEIVCQLSRSK